MISGRISEHVKNHNWFAVAIDFVIVVIGVFIGMQVSNWNEAAAERRRTALVVEGLRQDVRDAIRFTEMIDTKIDAGIAAFDAARERGERPAPYVYRTPGSESAPTNVFEAALQSGLADLVHPTLLFDLGSYYSEFDGIGARYARYSAFVENEVLPVLGAGPDAFYGADGKLKPEFAANMMRLREIQSFLRAMEASAKCLDERFENPTRPGKSCRPAYGDAWEVIP